MAYSVKIDDREFRIDVGTAGQSAVYSVDGKDMPVEVIERGPQGDYVLVVDNRPYVVSVGADDSAIVVNGEEYTVEVLDEHVKKLLMAGTDKLQKKELVIAAPMPGLIIEIEAQDGETVKKGQGLLVVEAMKMQNEIKSPREGVVKQVLVKKGQTVNSKDKLVIIE